MALNALLPAAVVADVDGAALVAVDVVNADVDELAAKELPLLPPKENDDAVAAGAVVVVLLSSAVLEAPALPPNEKDDDDDAGFAVAEASSGLLPPNEPKDDVADAAGAIAAASLGLATPKPKPVEAAADSDAFLGELLLNENALVLADGAIALEGADPKENELGGFDAPVALAPKENPPVGAAGATAGVVPNENALLPEEEAAAGAAVVAVVAAAGAPVDVVANEKPPPVGGAVEAAVEPKEKPPLLLLPVAAGVVPNEKPPPVLPPVLPLLPNVNDMLLYCVAMVNRVDGGEAAFLCDAGRTNIGCSWLLRDRLCAQVHSGIQTIRSRMRRV